MSSKHKLCIGSLTLFAVTFIFAQSAEERGLQIAKDCDKANDGWVGEVSDMQMVLINAYGDKTIRKLSTLTREVSGDGDQLTSTFELPADVKGTKMLTWSHKGEDDDQWLYMPALKRVKRISSSNKSGSFLGSEFSYEDLGSQEVEKYSHKYLGEAQVEGRPCWKNERIPVSKRSGYSKQIVYLDKTYMNPVKVEYFDRRGDLMKISVFRNYQKMDKWWRVGEIEVENVQTKKKSVITWTKRQLKSDIDPSSFESEALGNN